MDGGVASGRLLRHFKLSAQVGYSGRWWATEALECPGIGYLNNL